MRSIRWESGNLNDPFCDHVIEHDAHEWSEESSTTMTARFSSSICRASFPEPRKGKAGRCCARRFARQQLLDQSSAAEIAESVLTDLLAVGHCVEARALHVTNQKDLGSLVGACMD